MQNFDLKTAPKEDKNCATIDELSSLVLFASVFAAFFLLSPEIILNELLLIGERISWGDPKYSLSDICPTKPKMVVQIDPTTRQRPRTEDQLSVPDKLICTRLATLTTVT